jgi:hypothetical protein
MAYSQGGLIEATDYNNLINGSNQLNTVWSTGTGNAGYGQTTIGTVAATNTVTAAQWATLINALNNARSHQSGSGSGITAVTAGQTINHLSTLQTQVNSAYTNRLSYVAQGATTTGANFDAGVSSTTGLSNYTIDRTVTFASANQARYFFNAGGQLNLVLSAINSADSGSENSFGRLVSGLGGIGFRATANTGRTGTGITLNTNNTAFGYYNNVFNSATTLVQVTDTTASYTASTGFIQVYTSSSDTTNGAKGLNVVFRTVYSIADKTWDDTLSLTYRTRVDIVPPSTTYLSNSWGSITVS